MPIEINFFCCCYWRVNLSLIFFLLLISLVILLKLTLMFFFQLFFNRTLSTCQWIFSCNWFLMNGERENKKKFLLVFQSSKCMKRIVCDDWLQILYLVTIDLFFLFFTCHFLLCLSMKSSWTGGDQQCVCVCEMKYKENKSQAIIFLSTMKCEERLVDMRRMRFLIIN